MSAKSADFFNSPYLNKNSQEAISKNPDNVFGENRFAVLQDVQQLDVLKPCTSRPKTFNNLNSIKIHPPTINKKSSSPKTFTVGLKNGKLAVDLSRKTPLHTKRPSSCSSKNYPAKPRQHVELHKKFTAYTNRQIKTTKRKNPKCLINANSAEAIPTEYTCGPKPIVRLTIFDTIFDALLDTGSQVNVISQEKLSPNIVKNLAPAPCSVVSYTGNEIQILGIFKTDAFIDDIKLTETCFYVTSNPRQTIIGTPAINNNKIQIDIAIKTSIWTKKQ